MNVWDAFCAINARRRAIRDFDGQPVPDEDVRAILEQALLAPSSGNLQPYQFHWIRDPERKRAVAAACNGQRAASQAATLVVLVAGRSVAKRTAQAQREHIDACPQLSPKSKLYHRGQLRKFELLLRYAALLSPLGWMLRWLFPVLSLLPVGLGGIRHWTARGGVYAAQTLTLAASARGYDSCPIEGFNARKLAKILNLPRQAVIPVVIALGRRAPQARVEPRWRRVFEEGVVQC